MPYGTIVYAKTKSETYHGFPSPNKTYTPEGVLFICDELVQADLAILHNVG